MADYSKSRKTDEMFPDEGYSLVVVDSFKPPDEDDYANIVSEFDDSDFSLPSEKPGYAYYVHCADGEVFTREDWPPE